jgi:mannosyltransferase
MATTGAIRAATATDPRGTETSIGSSGEPNARGRRLTDLAVIGLPALLALALCLYELTARSLWLDEAATVAIASQHGAAFGAALAHEGGNMLGYYALMHVLIGLFGTGSLVIRLPCAIAAAATVAIVGRLAMRLFGRRIALASGLLTAASLSLVYWGQNARGYVPMIALIAASFLSFVALLEEDAGWRAWVTYVVVSTAAVYAGLEAVLVVPAQLVVLLWYRNRAGAVASAVAATAAFCIPLVVLAVNRGSGQLFWVPPPSWSGLKQIIQALSSSGLQPSFYTSSGTALLVLSVVVLAAGALRTARLTIAGDAGGAWRPVLVLSWLVVPVLLALLESAIGQSIFQARYLLVSLPAVSLLLGWTVAERRVAAPLMLALLAALITLRALQVAPAYGVSTENWRGATGSVIARAQPGDCVAFYPLDNRQAFRYYLTSTAGAPRPILPTLPWNRVRPFVEDYASLSASALARLPLECTRVWLLSSHEGKAGGPPLSRGNYVRFVELTGGLRREYPVAHSASFGVDALVTVTLYAR